MKNACKMLVKNILPKGSYNANVRILYTLYPPFFKHPQALCCSTQRCHSWKILRGAARSRDALAHLGMRVWLDNYDCIFVPVYFVDSFSGLDSGHSGHTVNQCWLRICIDFVVKRPKPRVMGISKVGLMQYKAGPCCMWIRRIGVYMFFSLKWSVPIVN